MMKKKKNIRLFFLKKNSKWYTVKKNIIDD